MRNTLFTIFVALVAIGARRAGAGTFVVQDGAFPWSDRVNVWALAHVPDSLKGTGPLPQQSCDGRSLDVPGRPKQIVIGVAKKDLQRFTEKFPSAKETGEDIAVEHPGGGGLIPYRVLTFPNPPEHIDGKSAALEAGLLLLKVETDAATQPAP